MFDIFCLSENNLNTRLPAVNQISKITVGDAFAS